MPYLDARALDTDPDGLERLRSVIASAAGGALAYDPEAFQPRAHSTARVPGASLWTATLQRLRPVRRSHLPAASTATAA